MQTGQTIDTGDISNRLFWGAVMKVAACRFSDAPFTPLDVVLDYLGSAGEGMDERMKLALVKLVNDLRTIASFTDSTITEIFERHPKSFSRVLTLFFLREKCADLLSFKHPLLTESDHHRRRYSVRCPGWLAGATASIAQLPQFSGCHFAPYGSNGSSHGQYRP